VIVVVVTVNTGAGFVTTMVTFTMTDRELVALTGLAINGTSFGTIGVNCSVTVTVIRLVLSVGAKEPSVVAPAEQ
jgi:hypothetical protein